MKATYFQTYAPVLLAILIGAVLGAALGYFGECTSGTCPLTSTWWRGALYGSVMGLLFGLTSTPRPAAVASEVARPALESEKARPGNNHPNTGAEK